MEWTRLFPQNHAPSIFVDNSPVPDEVLEALDNPQSFGTHFNIIRAVAEYGPMRIKEISKRLDTLQTERDKLLAEVKMLEQLVAVVQAPE